VDKRRWLGRLSIGVHYTTKEDDMRLVGGICAGQFGWESYPLVSARERHPDVFQNLRSTERPTLKIEGGAPSVLC
jgi:hypothetical protein